MNPSGMHRLLLLRLPVFSVGFFLGLLTRLFSFRLALLLGFPGFCVIRVDDFCSFRPGIFSRLFLRKNRAGA